MDVRPTWTDCDEAGVYSLPNVLRPRDLVSRPCNMDETIPLVGARRAHQILRISGRSLPVFINLRVIRKNKGCPFSGRQNFIDIWIEGHK